MQQMQVFKLTQMPSSGSALNELDIKPMNKWAEILTCLSFPQKTINNARKYAISLDKTLYNKLLFA